MHDTKKTTINLELGEEEVAALSRLSQAKDISIQKVIIQAIRVYESIDNRLINADRLMVREHNGDITEFYPVSPGLGIVD